MAHGPFTKQALAAAQIALESLKKAVENGSKAYAITNIHNNPEAYIINEQVDVELFIAIHRFKDTVAVAKLAATAENAKMNMIAEAAVETAFLIVNTMYDAHDPVPYRFFIQYTKASTAIMQKLMEKINAESSTDEETIYDGDVYYSLKRICNYRLMEEKALTTLDAIVNQETDATLADYQGAAHVVRRRAKTNYIYV